MSIEKWEMIPSSHPNRYIIRLACERADAERIVEAFPHLCTGPREMSDAAYKWGVMVEGASLTDRLAIQDKLREATAPVEVFVPPEIDLSGVLAELSMVLDELTGLTEEEKEHVARKMELIKQREADQALQAVKNATLRPRPPVKKPPETRPPVLKPEAPKAPPPPSAPLPPKIESTADVLSGFIESLPKLGKGDAAPAKPAEPSNAPEPPDQEFKNLRDVAPAPAKPAVPAPPATPPPPVKKDATIPPTKPFPPAPAVRKDATIPPTKPPVTPTPPPLSAPLPPAAVPAAAVPSAQGIGGLTTPPTEGAKDSVENDLQIACFFPPEEENLKDQFLKQLLDTTQKKAKKPLALKPVLVKPGPISHQMSAQWVRECQESGVNCFFVILSRDLLPDYLETAVQDAHNAGLHCFLVPAAEVSSRLLYVDLMVELMLVRKRK